MSHALRAYLDAGSGSMILQVVVGGFAAAAVSLKLFWRRILSFLGIRKDEDKDASTSTATTDASSEQHGKDEPAVAEPTR